MRPTFEAGRRAVRDSTRLLPTRFALTSAAVLLLASLVGCGSSARTVNLKIQSDPRIERGASERYREILNRLQPPAREKLRRATRAFAQRIGPCPDAEDPALIAEQEVEAAFETSSEAQIDVLTFAIMAGLADALTHRLDTLGDMDEMAGLRLQMAMDRRSKFMSALSNVLKKMADTNSSVVQNLK
jgi:hypothetical protein